jgi:hypothetical protein
VHLLAIWRLVQEWVLQSPLPVTDDWAAILVQLKAEVTMSRDFFCYIIFEVEAEAPVCWSIVRTAFFEKSFPLSLFPIFYLVLLH